LPRTPVTLRPVILLAGVLTIAVVAGITLFGGDCGAWTTGPRDADASPAPSCRRVPPHGGAIGLARYHAFAVLSLGISVFFWLFPFGPRINPSDRLTLSLFVTAALLMVVGTVTMVRFVRLRPLVSAEDGHAR